MLKNGGDNQIHQLKTAALLKRGVHIFLSYPNLQIKVYYLAAEPQNIIFAPRSRAAVARRAHNPKVTGSIPVFATKNPQINRFEVFLFLAQVFSAIEFDYLHFNSLR